MTVTPVIAGIGESEFARSATRPYTALQCDAIQRALDDAGLEAKDIRAVFSEANVTPQLFPIDEVQGIFGFDDIDTVGYFGLGGAGLGLALRNAAEAVRSGRTRAALVYFGVNWGSAAGGPYGFHDRYEAKTHLERPFGFYGQPTYFAMIAQRYAWTYGVGIDAMRTALGQIAVMQRRAARTNASSQRTDVLTLDGYFEGRPISDPLNVHDCCLISDGAGALIVTDEATARQSSSHAPVGILGVGYSSAALADATSLTQPAAYPAVESAGRSSAAAFAAAGVTPDDLDFAEIYDCFTISVLTQLEQLGVCEPGGGVDYIARRFDDDASTIPINTHGGFLSQAYLLGINHFTEAVRQLRGQAGEGQVQGAEVGAVSLAPGREHSTVVLGRL